MPKFQDPETEHAYMKGLARLVRNAGHEMPEAWSQRLREANGEYGEILRRMLGYGSVDEMILHALSAGYHQPIPVDNALYGPMLRWLGLC